MNCEISAPSSRFSKSADTGTRVWRKTQAPLTLPGSRSTAEHVDQSIMLKSYHHCGLCGPTCPNEVERHLTRILLLPFRSWNTRPSSFSENCGSAHEPRLRTYRLPGTTSNRDKFKRYIFCAAQSALRDRACPTNGSDCGLTSLARSNVILYVRSSFL
jgi:hypothetical protein